MRVDLSFPPQIQHIIIVIAIVRTRRARIGHGCSTPSSSRPRSRWMCFFEFYFERRGKSMVGKNTDKNTYENANKNALGKSVWKPYVLRARHVKNNDTSPTRELNIRARLSWSRRLGRLNYTRSDGQDVCTRAIVSVRPGVPSSPPAPPARRLRWDLENDVSTTARPGRREQQKRETERDSEVRPRETRTRSGERFYLFVFDSSSTAARKFDRTAWITASETRAIIHRACTPVWRRAGRRGRIFREWLADGPVFAARASAASDLSAEICINR